MGWEFLIDELPRGIRRVKTKREGGWDEDGIPVRCDHCTHDYTGVQLRFRDGVWYCPNCEETATRSEFFSYIGPNELGSTCETCDGNYPVCRRGCKEYDYKKIK